MNKILPILMLLISSFGIPEAQEVIHLSSLPASSEMEWSGGERTTYSFWDRSAIVSNVSEPTLTAYFPEEAKSNGSALIIAPGGGFHGLSIENEGTKVATWCTERGMAAFILKYRLVPTGKNPFQEFAEKMQKGNKHMQETMGPYIKLAKADGLAAIAHVRKHASDYNIDPDRIGILGFSAGGTVAAGAGLEYTHGENRPNFIAPIYGALHLFNLENLPADPMPLFMAVTGDDIFGLQNQSIELYKSWNAARLPAELHIYEKGAHGFGMRKQDLPSDAWIDAFGAWLETHNF
jgi:acetyl esterase/lipase